MTEEELDGLGSALDDFLGPYLYCCGYTQTFGHLHTYCRGLLSDLKRKSTEPIALASGCVGKIDNGIVTVHLGVCTGRYKTLIDAELFLPEDWAKDRDRCQAAGIPADMEYRPKQRSPWRRWTGPRPTKCYWTG